MSSSTKMWISALIASMTSFNFGINLTIHELSKETLTVTGSNGYLISSRLFDLFISIFAISALVSNLITPFIKLSKKYLLMVIDLLFLLGTFLILYSRCKYFLFVGRILQGFGFGFIGNSVPVYLSSVSTLDKKGMIGSLHQLFIVFGVLCGQILGYLFENKNYKIPYFIYMGTLAAHLCALSIIRKTSSQQNAPSKSLFELINKKEARKSLFLATFLHVTQQLSCINGIIFFSNSVQDDKSKAKMNTLIGGGIFVMSTIAAMPFVEKLGRKPMLLLSIFIDSLCLFGVALTKYTLACLLIFYVGFSLGLGPIVWSISAEIFPEDYLNAGLILAVNFNWALTFAIPYIFKQMYEKMGKNAFYFFAIYLIAAFVILLFMFSETKNRKPAFQ